jgi:hypothetical protein
MHQHLWSGTETNHEPAFEMTPKKTKQGHRARRDTLPFMQQTKLK